MTPMSATKLDVLVAFNEPTLPADDPDRAAEEGVLESVEAVSSALASRGHRVNRLGVRTANQLFESLAGIGSADVVVNLVEGLDGRGQGEAQVAGLFELQGHPLTGSASEVLALTRDKPRTKWLLRGAGLPTPPFEVLNTCDPVDCERLRALLAGGPVIVKPAREDGSLGIDSRSIVTDFESFKSQANRVRQRYGAALAERFIVGREFNAAVIALPDAQALPLAEIEFCGNGKPGWQIVTYDAKWSLGSAADCGTPARCPANVNTAVANRISTLALAAFQAAGCRDYARIDLRMDCEGQLYVLEVNCNPDIGPAAGFTRALAAAGLSYEDFIDRMTHGAAKRRSLAATRGTASLAGGRTAT